MKKMIVLAACMVLVATAAFAGIAGTRHDLNAAVGGITTELCAYCHTPHAGAPAATMSPLWNRNQGTTLFNFYGATARGTAQIAALGAKSAACMSCHDGVTGVNNIINVPGPGLGTSNNNLPVGAGAFVTNNAAVIGTDLTNDHPVSIVYNAANGLNALNGTTGDGVVRVNWPAPTAGVTGAVGDRVECVSCHDPHVDTPSNFLRLANGSSVLCLRCHNK